jgi:nucleotide-binding universal stress UspA family protein
MKILLAVDGSECSANAVHEVATRPWREGTQLKILSVVGTPIPFPIPDPFLVLEGLRVNLMKEERKRLEIFVEEMRTSIHSSKAGEDLNIETEVLDGSPKEVIVDEAEKWDADLIVVGCHGYGNVKKFVLGSVSEAVLAHAPCSVEIVRCKKDKTQ